MLRQLLLLLFLSSLVTACGSASSHAVTVPEPAAYRLQPGELVLAATEGDIPAITAESDLFVPAEKADLNGEDLIVGVLIGGQSRAYPVRLLSLHEVVNDQVGDTPIAVTWCPLCYSPVVFSRVVDGKVLSFRASGYLLKDNLVLIDNPTGTLWSQLLGQGIRGANRGRFLETLPASLTTWEAWRELYPETLVLSAGKLGYEGEIPDPYGGYFASGVSGLSGVEEIDQRLSGKTLVYGILAGEESTAVTLERLRTAGIVEIDLAPGRIVGFYDQRTDQGYFFLAEITDSGQVLEFSRRGKQIVDTGTGTVWNTATGIARTGELRGSQLVRYPVQLAYWFAWSSFHPDTSILN